MGVPASGRKEKASKLDKIKEAVAKGEEPAKFYHNMSKAGLVISVLVMMSVWIWLLFLYQDKPEAVMPIMIFGMVFLAYDGVLIGILEYWLYEKESTHIKLGHLAAMPFEFGEWKATVKVPYKTKDGKKVMDRWEIGRVGRTKWMWSSGGGKKGYYAVRILPRLFLDDSHNPPKVVKEEDVELAGYWEGSLYRVPIDCSRTYPDRLKEEVARKLRSDKRFREDSPIYAGEIALPEKFRAMDSVSDMMTKLHDRNERIAALTGIIRRMYIDMAIKDSTKPEITQKTVVYKGAGPEE